MLFFVLIPRAIAIYRKICPLRALSILGNYFSKR